MRITRINASFGVLQQRTLAFAPGLNILEAPNESGKSTLAIFLRTMLYGLNTRDRGLLADKNRFQPWTGAPMRGTLTLESEAYGAITLQRDTLRANSPMGQFSAVYAGTDEPVPALHADDCGETLLGVPREVFERSAFIRQSGLAIAPDSELERRIAALITTGEEGVPWSEAMAALKKQRNARRLNARSGTIPTLAREIDAYSDTLAALRDQRDAREDALREADALQEEEARLRAALRTHEIADVQQQYVAREYAKRDAESAQRQERQFRSMLADLHVPPQETLLEEQRRLEAADALTQQQTEADLARDAADAALHALRSGGRPPPLRTRGLLCLLAALLCAALTAAALLLPTRLPPVMRWAGAGIPVFLAPFLWELRRCKQLRRAYAHDEARQCDTLRDAEALCTALRAQRERILAQILDAVPVGDEASARSYLSENLARYDTLSELTRDAHAKRLHYESCPVPDLHGIPAYPVTRPPEPPEALRAALAHVSAQRAAAQSRADVAAGQLAVLGDPAVVEAELGQKREQLAAAQAEYDALTTAMEALEQANAALQSRFSPELGKRAAAYFSALTGGKYDALALDRSFRALATEHGAVVGHDAGLLSQGTGDQLYLAVRLAICDMVLPAERHVPLVLDDALVNFDDARCAAALELLQHIAQTRQVLLLSCQHREAAYLADRPNVNIATL
ncbi:MAG: AAA family ATPase [Oscillospiraceae bacterium]|nr:AAA family ATPase [Oscillospiraceae bacterium]